MFARLLQLLIAKLLENPDQISDFIVWLITLLNNKLEGETNLGGQVVDALSVREVSTEDMSAAYDGFITDDEICAVMEEVIEDEEAEDEAAEAAEEEAEQDLAEEQEEQE